MVKRKSTEFHLGFHFIFISVALNTT